LSVNFFDYFFFKKNKKIAKLFVILFFIFLIIILFLLFKNLTFSVFISICLFIIFQEVFDILSEKKALIINNQLMELIINMILMLKAGKTVRNIIKEYPIHTKPPMSIYLKKLSNQLEINISFDKAMDDFAENCRNREVFLFSNALKINNKIGGDLIFVLESISESLRDSLKIKSSINIATIQSRYSGSIIAMMPVAILVIMFFLMNNVIQSFFSTRTGNTCLIIGAALEISGIMIMRKMLRTGDK